MSELNGEQLQFDLTTKRRCEAASQSEIDGSLAVDERRLAERLADRLYERLAERLDGRAPAGTPDLLDAAEVARTLGCERGWVYEHKAELGAVQLGAGPRPRLRFARTRVEAIASAAPQPQSSARRTGRHRRPRARRAEATLLEVKGRAP